MRRASLASLILLLASGVLWAQGASPGGGTAAPLSGAGSLALQTAADATSITPIGGDFVIQSNTQAGGTLTMNAPTGSPSEGQLMLFRLKSTNAQTFAWNAIYNAPSANLSLPTASSGASLYDYYAFRYNAVTATWDLLAVSTGASSSLVTNAAVNAALTPSADANSLGLGTSALTQGGITGTDNTAIGQGAVLGAITSGEDNTAAGFQAGKGLTTGSDDTLVGNTAGVALTTGAQNVAIGSGALATATTQTDLVAVGYFAANVTTGNDNTALGYKALTSNTTATRSTAVGSFALASINVSGNNTAVGYQALGNGAGAANSTAVGTSALAGAAGTTNTAVGYFSGNVVTSGGSNILIGASDNITTGSNNILIGNSLTKASAASSNQINVGDLFFLNNASLATPALSACGTGSPTVDTHGNNRSGTITMGGGALASCTMTFAGSGYAVWNHCRVSPHATLATFAYSYTLTTMTITATSETAAVVDYSCDGL